MNKGSQYDPDVIAAMNSEKPYAQYIKTILGRVGVTILDSFSGEPQAILLEGEPNKNNKNAIVSMWSLTEDLYFKRMNKLHLENGTLIKFKADPEKDKEERMEQMSDEQLTELVNKPFLALQNALNRTTSEAFLFRILRAAEDAEKSEKITAAIKARLAEVQNAYVEKSNTEE